MGQYTDILRTRGVALYLLPEPIEAGGCYLPNEKILYISGCLSEIERNDVIIHEIGHLLNQHEINELNAPAVRLRQEREANEYLADQLINEYLQSCVTLPTYVNVSDFIAQRKLSNDLYTYIDISFRKILA